MIFLTFIFYVNDEPEGEFLCTETIELYCIVLYYIVSFLPCTHIVIVINAVTTREQLQDSVRHDHPGR